MLGHTNPALQTLAMPRLRRSPAGQPGQLTIGVDAREDGSGRVSVAVGLDEGALAQAPDLAKQLRTSDLAAAGWTVTGPEKGEDGLSWFRAEKPFTTPEQANRVLAELAGENGPFRDFRLRRERSFARTRFRFSGMVDFGGGLESFGDPDLARSLDGEPLGEDVSAIEARIGQSIDRVFRFKVAVRLPGEVSSNAPVKAGNGAVWRPTLSEPGPIRLRAESEQWRTAPLAWLAVGLAAAAALVVLLAVSLARRWRRRPAG